jgi:UDP-N-acetylmuramoyl-L-alanyl-D-glutamate--2,6-diaminopimelate ligase
LNTAQNAVTKMFLAELLQDIGPDYISEDVFAHVTVSGMTMDSRLVAPGDLFIALFGRNHDARDYINVALQRGASSVIADAGGQWRDCLWMGGVPVIAVEGLRAKAGHIAARFYAHPASCQPVIGVTGTNGKTSCTQFIAQILAGLGKRCGVVGTLGYGVYPELQDTGFTTPDAIVLQKSLAEIAATNVSCIAMEVSSQGLHQHRLNGVSFNSAVFTNLTRDHLDYHGSMAAYAEAKRRLFEYEGLKAGVINMDDSYAACMLNALPRSAASFTYSISDARADVHAISLEFRADGYAARIHTPWGEGELRGRLLGSFNFSNVLSAIAAVMTLPEEYPLNDVLQQAALLKPVTGRMEIVGDTDEVTAVVDYAHTPDGLRSALQALRQHVSGDIWCVFGCGGNRDQGKRPLMAEVADELADQIVITDDNPRNENADDIVRQILLGFNDKSRAIVERDRAKAISLVIGQARRGDVVLVAGKGHENYQDVCGQRLAFSDAAHVRLALQQRRAKSSHSHGGRP